jgi:hypothetical protein
VFLNTEPFLARMNEVKIITPLTSLCVLCVCVCVCVRMRACVCVHVRPDETEVRYTAQPSDERRGGSTDV